MNTQPQVIQALRKLLSAGDELDRCCACRSLGVLGDSRAANDLIERLGDEDIDVCLDAVESLGKLAEPAAVPALIELLHNDPNGDVKTAAVEALGHIGTADVIPHLITVAKKPPENLEWEDDDWDSWWDIQLKAVQALGLLRATDAVPVLEGILQDDDGQDIETEVLHAMAHIGGPGEEVLLKRLRQGRPKDRRRTVRALAYSQSAESLRALGRALQDDNEDVRATAIETLVARRSTNYLNAIVLLLKDPAAVVRHTALTATAAISKHNNLEIDFDSLIPLLDDQDPDVRVAVLNILTESFPSDELPRINRQIQGLLENRDPIVATAACNIAARLTDSDTLTQLISILTNAKLEASLRDQSALAIGKRGQVTAEVLASLTVSLTDETQTVRLSSLQALMDLEQATVGQIETTGTSGDQPSLSPLQILLSGLSGTIQIGAKDEESQQDDSSQAETHMESERSEINTVQNRRHGRLLPAKTAEPSIQQTEFDEATDTDPTDSIDQTMTMDTGRAVTSTLDAIALANIENAVLPGKGEDPETDIIQLSDEDKQKFHDHLQILDKNLENKKRFYDKDQFDLAADVRCLSARVLANTDNAEAVAALKKAMHDPDPDIQKEAVNSLATIAKRGLVTIDLDDTIGPLISFLHIGTRDLRVASIHALGTIGNASSFSPLRECLLDTDIVTRSWAVQALTDILLSETRRDISQNKLKKLYGVTANEIIGELIDRLTDDDMGVRKTTASALSRLKHLLSPDDFKMKTIKALVDAGFAGQGEQSRHMARVLRSLDPEKAGIHLLEEFDKSPDSIHRRFVIEMLEELFKPLDKAA